jgi:hypothetical protein
VRVIRELGAIGLLCIVKAPAFQKGGAEPMERRERQRLRLVVDKRRLQIGGTLESSDGPLRSPAVR